MLSEREDNKTNFTFLPIQRDNRNKINNIILKRIVSSFHENRKCE